MELKNDDSYLRIPIRAGRSRGRRMRAADASGGRPKGAEAAGHRKFSSETQVALFQLEFDHSVLNANPHKGGPHSGGPPSMISWIADTPGKVKQRDTAKTRGILPSHARHFWVEFFFEDSLILGLNQLTPKSVFFVQLGIGRLCHLFIRMNRKFLGPVFQKS